MSNCCCWIKQWNVFWQRLICFPPIKSTLALRYPLVVTTSLLKLLWLNAGSANRFLKESLWSGFLLKISLKWFQSRNRSVIIDIYQRPPSFRDLNQNASVAWTSPQRNKPLFLALKWRSLCIRRPPRRTTPVEEMRSALEKLFIVINKRNYRKNSNTRVRLLIFQTYIHTFPYIHRYIYIYIW